MVWCTMPTGARAHGGNKVSTMGVDTVACQTRINSLSVLPCLFTRPAPGCCAVGGAGFGLQLQTAACGSPHGGGHLSPTLLGLFAVRVCVFPLSEGETRLQP